MTKIAIVGRQSPNAVDGIRDHSFALGAALRAAGMEVDLHLRTPEGHWIRDPGGVARDRIGPGLASYDAVLIQYNPFMWGRWGFAPWLPAELWRMRLRRRRPRIALMVHEPFVPMTDWGWTLMGLWQRTQLAALRPAADVVFVSIEAWTRRFSAWQPQRPTFHLPVGSNFPDRSVAREDERARLGVEADDVVLAMVDTGGSARSPQLVTAALERLAEDGRSVVLLVLGAGASLPPDVPAAIESHLPGPLGAQAFASRLAAADIFLAPYVDGVSTRRGSMMVALQHGVAVLGTNGFLTDNVLRGATAALRLAPVDRPDLFAEEAARLAANADERGALGRAGRVLYLERFDWPVLARELLDRLAL